MIAIRTAGVCLAAGLIVGCQHKQPQARVVKPEAPSMQASETLRQSLVRANPNARVGIVSATYDRYASVADVPAGTVPEDSSVQILDGRGDVIGYGIVRAVKNNAIHVLYQSDARRGPQVGDLIMPASDAGAPAPEVMPAGASQQPADASPADAQPAAPTTHLPPRRSATPAETPAAAPAAAPEAAPTAVQPPANDTAAPAAAPATAQPQEPAPATKVEPQPDAKPADAPDAKPAVEPAPKADASAPAEAPKDAAAEPAPKADAGAPAADAPKDAAAEQKAAEPKPADSDKAAEKPADKPSDNK
jgi:hypothetical protein